MSVPCTPHAISGLAQTLHVSPPCRIAQPRRMRLAAQLWAAGIRAEFGYKANPKMPDQVSAYLLLASCVALHIAPCSRPGESAGCCRQAALHCTLRLAAIR